MMQHKVNETNKATKLTQCGKIREMKVEGRLQLTPPTNANM